MLENGNSNTKFFGEKEKFSWNFIIPCPFFLLHIGNKGKAREVLIKIWKIVMKTCERFEKDKKYSMSSKKKWDLDAIYHYIIVMNTVQSMPAPAAQMPSDQKSHHLQKQEMNGYPQLNVRNNWWTIFAFWVLLCVKETRWLEEQSKFQHRKSSLYCATKFSEEPQNGEILKTSYDTILPN